MQLVRIQSIQVYELEQMTLKVEAVCHKGTQNIQFSGLIDSQLKDAMEKVRSLIARFCKWQVLDHIIVNLEPSWALKRGSHHELAIFCVIALAIQKAQRNATANIHTNLQPQISQAPDHAPSRVYEINLPFLGNLDLEGNISHNNFTQKLFDSGLPFIGAHNYSHVSEIVKDIQASSPRTLFQDKATETLQKNNCKSFQAEPNPIHVKGRIEERLALIAAACAQLPVLLLGAPGVGKSHLAQWAVHTVPPPLKEDQQKIELYWASAGLQYTEDETPHFSPHSRAHVADFIGKRSQGEYLPGYFSLAHRGVLVLDEFPELSRDAREIFRIVLESKTVQTVSKRRHLKLDADFWLIATANPCACGKSIPSSRQFCECSLSQWRSYRQRFSGPLLDRFGVHLYLDSNEQSSFATKEAEILAHEWTHSSRDEHHKRIRQIRGVIAQSSTRLNHEQVEEFPVNTERQKGHYLRLLQALTAMGFSFRDSEFLAGQWVRKVEFHA